jgi:hypothetical protein
MSFLGLNRADSAGPLLTSPSLQASQEHESKVSPTITVEEAETLINLLAVIRELRAKGMVVNWDVQTVPTMNRKDYCFFWIYNATAQAQRDIGSII